MPPAGREYAGARSAANANATRAVFRATPNRRTISLIGTFSVLLTATLTAVGSDVATAATPRANPQVWVPNIASAQLRGM